MEVMVDKYLDAMIDVTETEKKLSDFLIVLHNLKEQFESEQKQETFAVLSVVDDYLHLLQSKLVQVIKKVDDLESERRENNIKS